MAVGLAPYVWLAGIVAAGIALAADLRRRRLSFNHKAGWSLLAIGDVASPAISAGFAAGCAVALASATAVPGVLSLAPFAAVLIFAFVWIEGRHQVQFQRPRGIVLGEWLILAGLCVVLGAGLLSGPDASAVFQLRMLGGAMIVAGAALIAAIVPAFLKKGEERHILERHREQGEIVQKEYTPPTPECPNPELWSMMDSQTTEVEVLDFLKHLVITVKPRLIVETGTFLGYGTLKMAEGLKANGFGKIITVEYDSAIYAKARERIEASGLSNWIEHRNGSSLDMRVEGTIDFLYSDSALGIREQEIRQFLPQVDPRGLIAIHDASSHFEVVRKAALRLEEEGLISVVLLSTPRGLVIAQKRAGRV